MSVLKAGGKGSKLYTMNPMSRIIWAIPVNITLLGILLVFLVNSRDSVSPMLKMIIFGFIILIMVIVISITIFFNYYAQAIENITFRLGKRYSAYIFNSINVRLQYLESDGSLVSYERDDHIAKLSFKKNEPLEVKLQSEGEIVKKDASSINSAVAFPSDKLAVFQCLFDKRAADEKQYCVDIILPKDREFSAELLTRQTKTPKIKSWLSSVI
jgi:hypothetical protein